MSVSPRSLRGVARSQKSRMRPDGAERKNDTERDAKKHKKLLEEQALVKELADADKELRELVKKAYEHNKEDLDYFGMLPKPNGKKRKRTGRQ